MSANVILQDTGQASIAPSGRLNAQALGKVPNLPNRKDAMRVALVVGIISPSKAL